MIISLHDAATGNTVTVIVDHSNFSCNKVYLDSETAGGSICIGQSIFEAGAGSRGNNVTLIGCYFYGNKALSGGGLSFSPAPQEVSNSYLVSLSLVNCVFESSVATLGSALHFLRFELVSKGNLLPVIFKGINVTSNSVITNYYYESSTGT